MNKTIPEKATVMDFISFAERYTDTFESINASYYLPSLPSADRFYATPKQLDKTLRNSCFGNVINYFRALEEDVATIYQDNIKIIL